MNDYARIFEGVVSEIFSTDGDMAEMFHPSMIWVDITEINPYPVVGWTAIEVGGVWSFSAPLPPVLTDAELQEATLSKRDTLLAAANEVTVGMSDAYVAGLLSEEDVKLFKAYASYKLALNKIVKQEGYPTDITWPVL